MRKLIVVLALALASLSTLQVRAQALTADEKTFIDKHITDIVTTETVRITDAALAKVFATPFYKIKVIIKEDSGSSSNDCIAARVGTQLINITSPGTDGDVPQMLKMFDPKFKLVADADAAALQKCLDLLYPPFSDDDKKLVKFTHKGNQWTFIRGSFFESSKGYIITTGPDGTPTAVKYMLKLP